MLPQFDGTDAFETRVWVGGGYLGDLMSWSFTRNLTGLPSNLSDSSNAVNGKLVPGPNRYASNDPLIDSAFVPPTPWTRRNDWPPKRGTDVWIDVRRSDPQYETEWTRVFTGFVDEVSGNTFDDIEISLVDAIDRFSQAVQIRALLASHPTLDGKASPTGMHLAHVVNQCFEAAGFYATLPPISNTKIRVPLLGTTHPLVGMPLSVSTGGTSKASAAYDGEGIRPGVTYRNFTGVWYPLGGGSADAFLLHRLHSLNANDYYLDLALWGSAGNTPLYTMKVLESGNVQALNSSGAVVCELDSEAGQVGNYVALVVRGNTMTLIGNVNVSGTVSGGSPVGYVRMRAGGLATVPGGFVMGSTTSSTVDEMSNICKWWEPTAVIEASAYVTTTTACTYCWNVQASTVLDSIADATCSHWGIDPEGRAHFLSTLTRLDEDIPSWDLELTDDTDIFDDLSWTSNWQDTCSQVKSVFEIPHIKLGKAGTSTGGVPLGMASVLLFEGSAQEIDPNENVEDFIHPEDEEDWIDVDGVPQLGYAEDDQAPGVIRVAGYANPSTKTGYPSNTEMMYGSWMSGIYDIQSDGDGTFIGTSYLSNTLTRLDPASFKLETQAHTKQVTTNWADHKPVAPALRGHGSPTIRGKAKITWGDGWFFSDSNGSDSAIYEHDAGRWAGDNGAGVAQVIYKLLSGEQARFEDVDIRPDLDVRLGHNALVNVTKLDGLSLVGLTSKLTMSYDASGLSMQLNLICPQAWQRSTTWGAVEDAYNEEVPDAMWETVEDLVNPDDTHTWQDFEDEGAPTSNG